MSDRVQALPCSPQVTGYKVMNFCLAFGIPDQVHAEEFFPKRDGSLAVPIPRRATSKGIVPQLNGRRTLEFVQHLKSQASAILGPAGSRFSEEVNRPQPALLILCSGKPPGLFEYLSRIHFLVLTFQNLGKVARDLSGRAVLAVKLEELTGGRHDILISRKDEVPVEQLQHHFLVTRVIAVSLHESLACPDETEAPSIPVIQVNEFEQGVGPFDRTGIQFSDLGLEVGGFLRDRIDFRFLTGELENPSSGKSEDGKKFVSFH